MKIQYLLLAGVAMPVMLAVSCTNELATPESMRQTQESFIRAEEPLFPTEYDKCVSMFAKAVNGAVQKNRDFRKLISSEVLLMVDGDYDVLLRTVSDKTLDISDTHLATKSAGNNIRVKDLLSAYYPENYRTKSSGGSIIEDLQEKYPDLQISVPVHADDWDSETYTPPVAFLPEDYCDSTVRVIPGYDADGNFIWIDALNEP